MDSVFEASFVYALEDKAVDSWKLSQLFQFPIENKANLLS